MEREIEIVPYYDDVQNAFKDLNVAWLQKYFYVEPIDEEIMSHPKQYIIDKGGYIYYAKVHGVIAGTFALLKSGDKEFELGKMAVDEKFQGLKIGNRMLEFAIKKAKDLGADKLILFSNTILQPAIHLYKKYGFKEMPLGSSEYKRANIKMEKELA